MIKSLIKALAEEIKADFKECMNHLIYLATNGKNGVLCPYVAGKIKLPEFKH